VLLFLSVFLNLLLKTYFSNSQLYFSPNLTILKSLPHQLPFLHILLIIIFNFASILHDFISFYPITTNQLTIKNLLKTYSFDLKDSKLNLLLKLLTLNNHNISPSSQKPDLTLSFSSMCPKHYFLKDFASLLLKTHLITLILGLKLTFLLIVDNSSLISIKRKFALLLEFNFVNILSYNSLNTFLNSIPSKNLTFFKSDEKKHLVLQTFTALLVIKNHVNTLMTKNSMTAPNFLMIY